MVQTVIILLVQGAVHKCQHFHECTNHIYILSETPPPPQKSTHQHFLSAKNHHENNKNQAKKLKVYRKNVDFQTPPWMLKTMSYIDNIKQRWYSYCDWYSGLGPNMCASSCLYYKVISFIGVLIVAGKTVNLAQIVCDQMTSCPAIRVLPLYNVHVWWPSGLRCWHQFLGYLWCDPH